VNVQSFQSSTAPVAGKSKQAHTPTAEPKPAATPKSSAAASSTRLLPEFEAFVHNEVSALSNAAEDLGPDFQASSQSFARYDTGTS
jgi:hypothetical protein